MNEKRDEIIDVLCVTTKLCIGGVQTYLINGVEPLLRNNIRLNFAVQTDDPQVFDSYVESHGCRIFHIHSLGDSRINFMRDIRSILKNNPEIRIVHSHQNFANVYSLLAAKGLAKTISHAHNNYQPKSFLNALLKSVFKLIVPLIADAYWACSDESARWLYGKYAAAKECHVIKNSVSTQKFKFDKNARSRIRAEYNLVNKLVWIHVGTLSHAKNHKFLLDLFSDSLKSNPDQHLIICGDGVLREEIESQIRNLGLCNNITLTGSKLNPQDYLSASDLLVFPSKFEGFPLSIIEAQANGITCICSSAVPEKCMINKNAAIIGRLSIPDFEEGIRRGLSIDFDRELGARNVIEAGFSVETEAKNIAKFYREVID